LRQKYLAYINISPVAQNKKGKIFNTKDLIAYFLVAGTGAVVQLICSSLIQDWFDLTFQQSIWPSYLLSFVVGFTLTKLFAFDARKTNQTRREMVKFLMVALFSGFVTDIFTRIAYYLSNTYLDVYTFVLPGSVKSVNINEMGCYIVGMGFSFISNYILHKTFTFKSTGFYDRLKVLIR
jgi:putative flippase GtrA